MNFVLPLLIAFLIASTAGFYFFDDSIFHPKTETEVGAETKETPTPQVSTLTTIDRSGQNLTAMPKEILSMTQTQQLDLSNNSLTGAIPAEIRLLQNLQVLNLSNNKMTGLPAEIGQLSKLRILNVSNNKLTGIPNELGNLQNLEVLDLSGNTISEQDLNVIRSKLPASTQIKL